MRLSEQKLKKLLFRKGLSLKQILARAKVSKTAYYAQLSRESVLPRSIIMLARALDVAPMAFLEDPAANEERARKLQKKLEEVMKTHPHANRENVWHTLLLLQEKPIERLERGLARAQKHNIYR